jgi:hypothetical protein
MIEHKEQKISQVVSIIKTRICEINERYRKGPSLYFYTRAFDLRINSTDVESFLRNDYHLEILYATLVSWDMNSRAAKMKSFDDFKNNLFSCLCLLKAMEEFEKKGDYASIQPVLRNAYRDLNLMESGGKLVSNSKILHFIFPNLCVPMDRKNTLKYFFGNTGESENKFLDIIDFCFDVMRLPEHWTQYLDNVWNKTIPKMIDNAILLLVGQSVK